MITIGGFMTVNADNFACFDLAGCVLREGLSDVRGFYDGGILSQPPVLPVVLGHEQMADYVQSRLTVLTEWMDDIAQTVNTELPRAMQAPMRGDAIEAPCRRMILFGRRLVSWENDVAGHHAPAQWSRVMSLLRGVTRPMARSLFHLAGEIADVPSRLRDGETGIDLSIRVPCPPEFRLLAEELPRASRAGIPIYQMTL